MESPLKIIADNPALFEELKKVLEKQFALGDLTPHDSDTTLGQSVRANLIGMIGIKRALDEINTHRTIKNENPEGPPR